jgi:hypothetical protein
MERIPPNMRGEHTVIIKTSISINAFLLEYASIKTKKNEKKSKKSGIHPVSGVQRPRPRPRRGFL